MDKTKAPMRRLGRPRDPAKAKAILDAGWSLFLERGVEAVPIETIAAKAGVSKGTVYASYTDKAALFEAAVLREMERIEAAQRMPVGVGDAPLADVLRVFGIGIMAFLASEPAISFYNALSAELRRQPALAQSFWDLGPGRTHTNLTAILAAAAARGEIAVASPTHAADMLFGLWQGFTNLQFALGVQPMQSSGTIEERVERGVDAFLRAFGTAAR